MSINYESHDLLPDYKPMVVDWEPVNSPIKAGEKLNILQDVLFIEVLWTPAVGWRTWVNHLDLGVPTLNLEQAKFNGLVAARDLLVMMTKIVEGLYEVHPFTAQHKEMVELRKTMEPKKETK